MAAFYQVLISSRTTPPDQATLLNAIRNVLGNTAGIVEVGLFPRTYQIKKNTAFTTNDISQAQAVIDSAPASTPQLSAQAIIDNMPIFEKALLLTLLDQINVLRTQLGLVTITVQQAITAVRNKAGTL